jgi:hypothetical protein
MTGRRKWAIVATAVMVAGAGSLASSVVAGADPSDDPCADSPVFFCRMLPMAPGLDGDIDLTQQMPEIDPAARLPVAAPAEVCIRGCV